jgi:hypothetical protein
LSSTNNNLLIVGASTYALVAYEIASDMGCFDRRDFVDDEKLTAPNDAKVIGEICDIYRFANEYSNIIVAIGDSNVRLLLLENIKKKDLYHIVSLISHRAYVSSSAQVMDGCIIEPMAVVHSSSVIGVGGIVSAGAVVNHKSVCSDGVHVDCNATIEGYCVVPKRTKICCGEVYKKNTLGY